MANAALAFPHVPSRHANYSKHAFSINSREDLTANAKAMYASVVHACGMSDHTDDTFALLARGAGLGSRLETARRASRELVELGIIARERDFSRPHAPWITTLLVDPNNGQPIRSEPSIPFPRLAVHNEPGYGHERPAVRSSTPGGAVIGDPHNSNRERQRELDLSSSTPTTTEVPVKDAELFTKVEHAFPDVKDKTRAFNQLVEAVGPMVVEATLAKAQARQRPGVKNPPAVFGWLDKVARTDAAMLEHRRAARPKAPVAEPVVETPCEPIPPGTWLKMREGLLNPAAEGTPV